MEYLSAGSGDAVILIHGFCETSNIWRNQLAVLSETFHVLVPDLPGFGKSSLKTSNLTMEYYASALVQMMDQERVYEASLVGHSMGGYVALAFAELFPDRISSLCLLHSTAYADSDQRKINRDRTADFIQKRGLKSFSDSFIPPLFRIETRKHFERDIQQIQTELLESPPDSIIAATLAMRDRPDRTEILKNLTIPVQIIAGKQDMALPVEVLREQAAMLKNGLLIELDDCGHMGMLEKPKEVNDFLLKGK
jgi:pimeloyl-ACP methyl ester carboxylesterase